MEFDQRFVKKESRSNAAKKYYSNLFTGKSYSTKEEADKAFSIPILPENVGKRFTLKKSTKGPLYLTDSKTGRSFWREENARTFLDSEVISEISKLDTWVQGQCKCKHNPEELIVRRQTLEDAFFNITDEQTQDLKLKPGTSIDTYKKDVNIKNYRYIHNTGGGKNDCLILAFLTCVSVSFRKAREDQKNAIASKFRREIFWQLPEFIDIFTKTGRLKEKQKIVKGTRMLTDEFISVLSNQYKVNILSLEGGKQDDVEGKNKAHFGKSVYQPPSVFYIHRKNMEDGIFLDPYEYSIIIYNIGNYHFEAVYKEGAPKEFIVSNDEEKRIRTNIIQLSPFEHGSQTNAVLEGIPIETKVKYTGDPTKVYTVFERIFNDSQNLTSYLLKKDIKNSAEEPTIAFLGEIERITEGGKTKKKRKVRKHLKR